MAVAPNAAYNNGLRLALDSLLLEATTFCA